MGALGGTLARGMARPLSVILPAWNEAERLGATLEAVGAFLSAHAPGGEVLVVDDGSTDGTPDVARRLGARVLVHPENRGKGAAVRTGMLAAEGDFRLFCDVDLSTPMEEALRLRAALERGGAVALGSRMISGATVTRARQRRRAALSVVFNQLIRELAPGVSDTQCGFKMFTAEAANLLFRRSRINRYAFDVEVLLIARRHGLRIEEVPIRWAEADSSRVRLVRDGARMLVDLARITAFNARGAYA